MLLTLHYLISETIFSLGRYLALEIVTIKSHMKDYVGQKIFLAKVMLNKTSYRTQL